MPVDLSGRVALVTGASRGIGLATAKAFVAAGATVVLNARMVEPGLIDALCAGRPDAAIAMEGAIDDPETVRRMIRDIFTLFRRLDILVNNAGMMRSGVIGMVSDADIAETLDVNLAGMLHMTQAAARLMARSGGSIVNLSSIVGLRGASGQMVYAAAKAGILGATRAAAKELAPRGIRVNAVAPGFIETAMTDALSPEVRGKALSSIALGRLGSPEEVADVVLFLASDLARYVTGQVIGVDGGMAA